MLLTIPTIVGVGLTENTSQETQYLEIEGNPVTAVSGSGELGGRGSRLFPSFFGFFRKTEGLTGCFFVFAVMGFTEQLFLVNVGLGLRYREVL